MPRATSAADGVRAGDVIVAPGEGNTVPLFVVRCAPGPDQFGCATLAAATRLARAFAASAGVDVWLADPADRVSPLARFRGLGRSAAPPARVVPGTTPRLPDGSVQNSTPRTAPALYS